MVAALAEPLKAEDGVASPQEVIHQQAVSQDYVVLRFAVLGLIVALAISLVGAIVLTYAGHEIPEGIVAIGSACVGAVSTMLVRSSAGAR